jgi:fructose-1,6-bisphosphatase/inositol monophosphatase family enzyme
MNADIGLLLSVCIDAAQRAGNEIRKVWKSGNLGIKDKGNDDPFTIADVNAQKLIMGLLSKQFPELPMIGEEDIGIFTEVFAILQICRESIYSMFV